MGTITVVANTKGGVSKTTTAVNLGVMLARRGLSVLMIDSDVGQSLAQWAGARGPESRAALEPPREALPFIEVVSLFDQSGTYYQQLEAKAAKYDHVIVDVGGEGRGEKEIAQALIVAQQVIAPSRPDPADIKRIKPMHTMIDRAKGTVNPTLRAMLFPVQASSHPAADDVATFYKKVAEFHHFELLGSVMATRNAYKTWADDGEAIVEQKPLDKKALAECEAVFSEVFPNV
jgi:chromosome partitioning protein